MPRVSEKRRYNEITIFLVNLFFIEVIGRFLISFLMFLFRLFGMEYIPQAYQSIPNHGHFTFILLMCIAVIISIIRIIKSK